MAVMRAGDIDHDENIFVSDYNRWAAGFGTSSGYLVTDLDMDRNAFVSDYNKWAANFGSTTNVGAGGCAFVDNRDGHVYKCITIGSQTWMAENLAWLPSVSPPTAASDTDPYYYVVGYEGSTVSAAKATANFGIYGVLYNWPAAMTDCPSGWHLPTDEEWKVLEKNQGMSISEADADGWRYSSTVGGRLKESGMAHWSGPNTGATNTSGFTALAGGYRYGGVFSNFGNYTYFWSASESGSLYAWDRFLNNLTDGVGRDFSNRNDGFSVRCIQNN